MMSGNLDLIIFCKKYYGLAIALSVCVLLETVSFTYMQERGGTFYYSSSIIYLLCGIAISLLPLIGYSTGSALIREVKILSKYLPLLIAVLFLLAVIYHIQILNTFYTKIAINKSWGDMLPAIQIACRRFWAGQTIYGPTPEIWPDSVLQYFPMMWIPFLPAELFSFDYRWVTFGLQFLALSAALTPLFIKKKYAPFFPTLIAGISFFLFINFFLVKNPNYYILTEEGVVAAFYLLLGLALLRHNYWLIGIAITACTLSRYSLVFWIPVYFTFVFFTRPRSDFFKLLFSYIASMSALFIFPFFIRDPAYFFHIPATYTRFIDAFWSLNHLDQHIYYNVGLFKFFTAKTARSMNVWASLTGFLAPLILLSWVYKIKDRYALNTRYIAFAGLKLSLVFFFAFIAMPFQYVFVPLTLMSYVVLFDFLSRGSIGPPISGPEK